MQYGFEMTKERFHLSDNSIYYAWGIWPKGCIPLVQLDRKEIKATLEVENGASALGQGNENSGYTGIWVKMELQLPKNLDNFRKLTIYAVDGDKKEKWYTADVKHLKKLRCGIQYFIDSAAVNREEGNLVVRGWAAAEEEVTICALDEKGRKLPMEEKRNCRLDVSSQYKEMKKDARTGFYLAIRMEGASAVKLVFSTSKARADKQIAVSKSAVLMEKAGRYADKGIAYLRSHGVRGFVKKAVNKIQNRNDRPLPYEQWIVQHLPSEEDLAKQRKETFDYMPKISVVVPLYKTPEKYLLSLVDSLKNQSYENWELCLSDGSGKNSPLKELLARLQKEESRIKAISHETNLQISENTNAAMEIATGDYIAFADHDDELAPNAFYECVSALNRDKNIDVIYSDEDKMSMNGKRFFEPHFKPDFNIDLLCTVNYICHLFVVKRELMEEVGGLRSEYDGAQDHDFVLRCVEKAGKIHHIPKILYHWRCHEDSTAENPESKLYAFHAGAKAVKAHYDRIGVPVEISQGEYLGLYRTKFLRSYDPLISIIIPNKDHIDDLKRCIDSIEEKSTYKNYEYIIVENNSTEEETFRYYAELEAVNPKVRVVYWDGIFNYSAINNFGVQFAKGEYYLLLNNDTEIINPDCLEELLGYCMREDVGAVGARLYYDDDTIQHAGVVIGFGGLAGHCFVQQPRGFSGYCHRIICAQDYSAVTAACMMVKKTAFEEVEGLSTELQVAFNDIDFCMKLRKAGYLIVYNPYAELYHYESKSRGLEDTPEKVERFNREIATFESRWMDILVNGDPFYNPNLTLISQDFSLRRPSEKGWKSALIQ